jgi:hypothetical protein
MKKEKEAESIRNRLRANLGPKLAAKLGKLRLRDLSLDIADFKEQVGWENTSHEIGRLRDKIMCIPALAGLDFSRLRLSKASEAQVTAALWETLKRTFPSMNLRPR